MSTKPTKLGESELREIIRDKVKKHLNEAMRSERNTTMLFQSAIMNLLNQYHDRLANSQNQLLRNAYGKIRRANRDLANYFSGSWT